MTSNFFGISESAKEQPEIAKNGRKLLETAITLYSIEILTSNLFGGIPELTTKHQRLLEIAEISQKLPKKPVIVEKGQTLLKTAITLFWIEMLDFFIGFQS